MTSSPGTGVIRERAGMATFWATSMAVGVAAFIVLAAVAHAGRPGDLAASSAVLSLSFVLAVVPGAVQLRATADAANGVAPGLPARFVWTIAAVLAVGAAPAAAALAVPTASLLLLAAQFAVACRVSVQRGAFLGAGDHAAASRSMAAEAAVRIVAGAWLGAWLGATGVAAALLLGSLGAAAAGWRAAPAPRSAPWRMVVAPAIAVGMLMLLVNLDGLLVPGLLATPQADAYAAAALPVRGIFFALFTISWLAVPAAVHATQRRQLLTPVLLVLALGAAAGLTLLIVRPLLPIALGDPAPAAPLLALLAAATALASALATVLAMAVARELRQPWVATGIAAASLAAALLSARPSAEGVAQLVLIAVGAAFALTLARLLQLRDPQRSPAAGAPLLARR